MSFLTDVEIFVNCKECNKKYNLDENIDFKCNDCEEKWQLELTKDIFNDLMDSVEKNKIEEINGESIIGFKSELEKEYYLRGLKRGIEETLMTIASEYDDYADSLSLWEKYNEMKKAWSSQKINSKLCNPDKTRCKKCNGRGYLKE